MTARSAMLFLFGMCMGCDCILEQPLSSFMLLHPRMAQLQELSQQNLVRRLVQVSTCMGSFGGETLKPTFLFGSPLWLGRLARDSTWFRESNLLNDTARVVRSEVDELGRVKIWGEPALKCTQIYPIGYGVAISKLLREPCPDAVTFEVVRGDGLQFRAAGREHWVDAHLLGVWEFVVNGHARCEQNVRSPPSLACLSVIVALVVVIRSSRRQPSLLTCRRCRAFVVV